MPWRPLPRIAFAVAVFPFQPSSPADLPLELGDELYIIEQGGAEGQWYRGYLVAPPSLLAGLTSIKGQTLEARVFSGIFPKNCVEIRDILGDAEGRKNREKDNGDRAYSPLINGHTTVDRSSFPRIIANKGGLRVGTPTRMLVPGDDTPRSGSRASTPKSIAPRDPNAPKPAAPVPMLKIGDETPTSYEEPLVDEIASCLREWHSTNLHELLLTRQYGVLENTSNTVLELDLARRQLLHDVLTAQEKNAVRKETVWNLVKGNKMLTGEVIIRDPKRQGRLLTGEDSAIELTILQSQMSMLEGDPSQQADPVSLHHLLLEVNAVSGASPGPLTLAFHLASKLETGSLKPLSETFTLDVPTPEAFATLAHSSKLRTLFTELSPLDFNEGSGGQAQLFLVVTVRASEPARQSLPPKVMTPHSRDGAPMLTRSASTLHSIKGSQKTRRSMMWKQRASEQHRPDPTSPTTPQSAESATQKEIKTSSAKDPSVIRTIGAGVLEIAPIMRQNKDIEQIVTIWSPLPEESEEDHQSEGFDELIRNIIPSPTGRYSKSYRASRLQIHLYPFVNSDSDALIRNNPTLMHDIAQTRRMGFPAAPNKPRSDIYLTLAQAVIPHDAVLSHPQTLQAPLPLHAGLRNLQLTLEVRDVAGNRIERCIFPSSSSTGHTAWRTTVAEKGTPWDQTICLKLSADQVVGSHVIMSVANAPEFPFGLCWLPLWDQQAFQRDGKHSLLLHAYDKHTSNIDETGKGAYISLPWSAPGKLEASKLDGLITPFAVVQIETNLCSTEFSQDQVILGLIHATDKEAIEVLELLRRVLFVPEIEIVKQLRSVFDALFNILVSNAGSEEYEDLIFNNLVRVLGIVHDRRFNLGPLVDRYIEDQFDFPSATPCLVRSYLRLLQGNIDSPQQSRTLRAAFKVGRHLLKFITNAREQQKEKEVDTEPTQVPVKFNKDMHSIFKALESLMRNPSPVLVGSKTLVVQHFHTWLPELASVLGKDEMIMIALSFMDSCKDVKGMLTLYKLVLIQNCARLPLFSSGQDRETFISGTVGWLEPYWGITGDVSDQYRDQVRLCSAIVAELVKTPEPQLYLFMPKIVASYCAIALEGVEETNYLSMLYSKSFPFQVKVSNRSQKFDEALVELAGLIAAISNIPDPVQPPLKGDDLAIFLSHALEAHRSIISCEAYPEDWLSLHIYHHRAAVKSMDFLLSLLIEAFLPSPEDADSFDMKLWEAFFATLLKVVSSASLALETFPEQKRRATWKIGGDVREQGANLLRRGWEAIGWDTTEEEREQFGLTSRGGFQVQYVPSLVPATIELCLSVHEGLRRVAVEILQTMILSEWDLNQDLTIIEMEIISSLDVAFQSKEMKENTAQKLFINELTDLFGGLEDNDDDGLSAAVRELIETIDELLDLLLACHNSGGMSESLHTLRLMEFMKDLGREDIFVRYVHELAQSQIAERNHAEAGLALQFHADLYDWDVTKLVPVSFNPALPEQTAFDRKEALYFDIIQHFEDGKAWTHALACYKELAEQYEHTVLDFSKLSRAQSSIAKIYEYIAKEHKYFPRYFRVTYRGLGFSPSLRDKQFIFEGPPSERMASFTDRMQKQYPAAQIISSGELEDIEGQFLQISAVSAHRNTGHPVYQRSKVPHSVREHLLISNPSQFSVTSKRHTNSGSVKEQWVEKTIFTTAESFPNLLRRSEIIVTEEVSLTPLQTAIERTWRKTQELILLEQRAVSGDDSTLSPLMEALNQLLDVGSSSPTCVAQYRQFLSQTEGSTTSPGVDENDYGEDEDESEPKPIDPQENALAVALIDHALAIRHALGLLARPAHQATQAELQRRFEDAFGPELSSLSVSPPPQTSLTTPRAVESRSTPVRNSASRDKQGLIRSISPEEELIRSSRSDEFRKHTASKSSIGQRISIMNPFKRANHATGDSVGTIKSFGMNLSNHHHSDSKTSKINGKTIESRSRSGSRNASTTQLSRRSGEGGVDDDAATVHSSRSKGTQSEKRKSWFGGDPKPLRRASPSLHGDAAEFSRPSTQKSVASPDRSDSVTAISTKSIDETRRFEVKSNDSPILASSEGSEGRKDGSDQGTSPTALPVSMTTALTERPSTRDSHRIGQLVDVKSTSHSVTISATNNSPPTGGMRDSVMKRFSLLKGVGRKNSRINVRDGGLSTGAGGVIAESVHE